jgi:DNA-binding CsgD family transcriptional regulator
MKLAAVLTAHVMDKVSHLPGVATLDWCDRAAAALASMHHPSICAVMLGRLDSKGFITVLESAGVAKSEAATHDHGPMSGSLRPSVGYVASRSDEEPSEMTRLRASFREGEWLGWSVGQLVEQRWFVSTASAMGLPSRHGEGPLGKRWENVGPAEMLLGAVTIPGEPGRILIVELVFPGVNKSIDRHEVVLGAALPMLGQKLVNAIGVETSDKHRWLTPREELVLWHLVAGKKVPVIAAELHRSVYTVHDHVKSLHRKLGASNRGQLVARALGHLGPLDVATAGEGTEEADQAEPSTAKAKAGRKPASKKAGKGH